MLPGHDRVVRVRDPAPSAAVGRPGGAWGARQRGGGARAAASGRGAAPAGAPAGSGTGGSGGAGRVVEAAAAGAVGGGLRHPGHAVALASQPDDAAVDLPVTAAG